MSLYREAGSRRRRRRLLLGAAAAAVVAAVVVVVVVAGGGAPSAADRARQARSAAGDALDRLELLGIEYPQTVGHGGASAPSELVGVQGHIRAAQATIADHAADIESVDPAALPTITAALAKIAGDIDRRVAPAVLAGDLRSARGPLERLAR